MAGRRNGANCGLDGKKMTRTIGNFSKHLQQARLENRVWRVQSRTLRRGAGHGVCCWPLRAQQSDIRGPVRWSKSQNTARWFRVYLLTCPDPDHHIVISYVPSTWPRPLLWHLLPAGPLSRVYLFRVSTCTYVTLETALVSNDGI